MHMIRWMTRSRKKPSKVVIAQDGLVRRHGAVASGHNARTCQEVIEMPDSSDSDIHSECCGGTVEDDCGKVVGSGPLA